MQFGKYQLAQSFEREGNYSDAARLYLELYEESKGRQNYFEDYIRTIKNTNEYSKLIPFVENHITKNPIPDNFITLGELYWLEGRTNDAKTEWKKALDKSTRLESTITKLASTQITLRLFSEAIETYLIGRNKLKNDNLYSDPLSQLYSIIGDYKKGTDEVIKNYKQTGNMPLTQGRLSSLQINEEATQYIYNQLERHAQREHIGFKQLFSWFLRKLNMLDKAFEITKEIDKETNSKGAEVYTLAMNLSSEGNYDLAIRAFKYIIEMGKDSPHTISALYQMTRTIELNISIDGKLDFNTTMDIIKRYRDIIKDYPNTPTADECKLHIAKLYKNQYKYDDAINELNQLVKKINYPAVGAQAYLALGNLYFIKDAANDAKAAYQKVTNLYHRFQNEFFDAQYALAEIEYFDGDLDSAMMLFSSMLTHPNSNVVNEAIERIHYINTYRNLNKAFDSFRQAEKKFKQNSFEEALDKFKSAAQSSFPENLFDLSLIKASKSAYLLSKPELAIEFLLELQQKKSESIYIDYCLLNIGKFYNEIGNFDSAYTNLFELIKSHPKSIYAEEARTLIREIKAKVN